MRAIIPARRARAHLVTEAQRPLSEDIAYRQRRYLIMMAIRGVCFAVAVALFVYVPGFFWAIPAVGAIVIPYFAVVFANGGREPTSTTGFRAYEPRLPVPHVPRERGFEPDASGSAGAPPEPGPFTASGRPEPGPFTASGRPEPGPFTDSGRPEPGSFTDSNHRPKGGQETVDRQ